MPFKIRFLRKYRVIFNLVITSWLEHFLFLIIGVLIQKKTGGSKNTNGLIIQCFGFSNKCGLTRNYWNFKTHYFILQLYHAKIIFFNKLRAEIRDKIRINFTKSAQKTSKSSLNFYRRLTSNAVEMLYFVTSSGVDMRSYSNQSSS
ncbi:hypothetical protein D3C85_1409510 [compost metagenome]